MPNASPAARRGRAPLCVLTGLPLVLLLLLVGCGSPSGTPAAGGTDDAAARSITTLVQQAGDRLDHDDLVGYCALLAPDLQPGWAADHGGGGAASPGCASPALQAASGGCGPCPTHVVTVQSVTTSGSTGTVTVRATGATVPTTIETTVRVVEQAGTWFLDDAAVCTVVCLPVAVFGGTGADAGETAPAGPTDVPSSALPVPPGFDTNPPAIPTATPGG